MKTVFDPLRKKEVAATPEENVRQWFISVLHGISGIPLHMMGSEVPFRLGAKRYRADIVVYDRTGSPLAVAECKRPDVEITAEVAEQALRYNAVLGVKFIFLTNGTATYSYRRNSDTFVPLASLPSWNVMLDGMD